MPVLAICFFLDYSAGTSETKNAVECTAISRSYFWLYHGSAIVIGHSAIFLAILSVFEQSLPPFKTPIFKSEALPPQNDLQ